MPSVVVGLFTSLPFLVTFFVYFQSLAFLWGKWTDSWSNPFSHGLLVVAIALFLIWDRRRLIRRQMNDVSYFALLLAAGVSIGWLCAALVNIIIVQALCLYALLVISFWALFGRRALLSIAVPAAFLVFAIPIWEFFTPYLRIATATVSSFAVNALGIPTFLEGTVIHVPAGVFNVEDSCSGLSYFLASLPLAALIAYTFEQSLPRRLFIFVCLPVLAIIANWLRVVIIVVAGQMTNMQHSLVHDHFTLGWIIFAVFTFFFMWWVRAKSVGLPLVDSEDDTEIPIARSQMLVKRFVVGLLLMVFLAIAFFSERYYREFDAIDLPAIELPSTMGAWQRLPNAAPLNRPAFAGADATAAATYTNGVQTIDLYFAAYRRQSQGRELVSTENTIYDHTQWNPYNVQPALLSLAGRDVYVFDLFNLAGTNASVMYWYTVGDKSTVSSIKQKLLELYDLLFAHRGSYAMVLTLYGHQAHDFSAAEIFIHELYRQQQE